MHRAHRSRRRGARGAVRAARDPIDPWAALGIGYGGAVVDTPGTVDATGNPASAPGSLVFTTPVLLRLDAGAEIAFDPTFTLGPWAAVTIESTSGAGDAMHAWLALGVRGSFMP